MIKNNIVQLVAVLTLFVGAACTRSHDLSTQEISRIFPDRPQGTFKVYSSAELKKRKLKNRDFMADINTTSSIDKRLQDGLTERHNKRFLYPSGVLEWNDTVRSQFSGKNAVSLHHRGELNNAAKILPLSETVECEEKRIVLSSGVIQRELSCSHLNVVAQAKKLGAEVTSCRVNPIGTRPIKVSSVFGEFKLKNDGTTYKRTTKEVKTISGEVLCNGSYKGMGLESRVTYYTNEDVNVDYPATGSHKILFQARSIKKPSGEIIYKSSDEITEVSPSRRQAHKLQKIKPLKVVYKKIHSKNKKRHRKMALSSK